MGRGLGLAVSERVSSLYTDSSGRVRAGARGRRSRGNAATTTAVMLARAAGLHRTAALAFAGWATC